MFKVGRFSRRNRIKIEALLVKPKYRPSNRISFEMHPVFEEEKFEKHFQETPK